MKTDIDALGTLTIRSETPLEMYALKHWLKDNYNFSDSNIENLVFVLEVDPEAGP